MSKALRILLVAFLAVFLWHSGATADDVVGDSTFDLDSSSDISQDSNEAQVVDGQADIAQALERKIETKLFYPTRAFSDGKRLYVVDSFNHRVLMYNTLDPVADREPDVVIGQPNSKFTTPNNGGVSSRSLLAPNSAFSDGKVLIIADTGNNRVLIYNEIPKEAFAPADVVIGQKDFNSRKPNADGVNEKGLWYPRDLWYDGENLYISDTFNHRVLMYRGLPQENYAGADLVLGQPDFSTNTENAGTQVTSRTLNYPTGLFSDGHYLLIADQMNNRVKVYDGAPDVNNQRCKIVIGQPDYSSGESNVGEIEPAANTLNNPTAIIYDNKQLYITDFGNNRVIVFNSIPNNNFANADTVIGQMDFTSR